MKKYHFQHGFTFIEMLIYVLIASTILTAISGYAMTTIKTGRKNTTEQELYAVARSVSERIKYEIRNANGINTSAFGTDLALSPSSIVSLANTINNPTVFDVSAGKVRIKLGAGTATNLNSTDTAVTSLIFTNYTSGDSKTKNIGFVMTITSSYAQSGPDYTDSVTIRSGAEIRSN